MKIAIYVGNLDPNIGGESTLTKTIMKEIANYKNNKYEFVFLYKNNKNSSYKEKMNGFEFICINKCNSIWNLLGNGIANSLGSTTNKFYYLDKLASREGIDLFYFAAPVLAQTTYPYIFTVWDLGHRTVPFFPEVSRDKQWTYREKTYSLMLPRASYIVTGNEEGKKEILRYYKVDEERIVIAPFPVTSMCFGEEKKPDFLSDEPFFFYPAQFWAHKNHICILEALSILKGKYGLEPAFYLTGSDQGNMNYIRNKITELKLEKQVMITGFLDDEEIKYMYTHAKSLVFASLMGPNNLPPIEAVYLKCPVIITDIPGHVEQMGDGALFFDGCNPGSLAEAMNIAMTDKDKMNEISKNADILKEKFQRVNYFDEISKIFGEYIMIRKRWS